MIRRRDCGAREERGGVWGSWRLLLLAWAQLPVGEQSVAFGAAGGFPEHGAGALHVQPALPLLVQGGVHAQRVRHRPQPGRRAWVHRREMFGGKIRIYRGHRCSSELSHTTGLDCHDAYPLQRHLSRLCGRELDYQDH